MLGQTVSGSGTPTLMVFDTAAGATAVQMLLQSVETVSDTFSIPASGQLQIAVFQARPFGSSDCTDPICTGAFGFTGEYRLVTLPFNPAPEACPRRSRSVILSEASRSRQLATSTSSRRRPRRVLRWRRGTT